MNPARRRPLVAVLLLALLLRAVLPSGWMPVPSASGISVVLCSAEGLRTALFDPGKDSAPSAPTPCPYALMAIALPHAPPLIVLLLVAMPIALAGLPLIGVTRRLSWVRPPPTAPPGFLSA